MSALKLAGSTSGVVTLQPPAVAGTNTINLPASSGTVVITPPGAAGQVLTSDGSKWTSADPAQLPSPGTSGQVLTSTGSSWVSSNLPSQLPSPSTNGNVLVSNGSSWVSADPQVIVLPDPGAVGSILISDGDRWVRGPILANLLKTSGNAPYFGARAHVKVRWKNSNNTWEIKGNPGNIASVVGPSTLDIRTLPTATFRFNFITPMPDEDYLVVYTPLGRKGKMTYNNDGDVFTTTTYFEITFTTELTPKDLDNKHPNELNVVVYK